MESFVSASVSTYTYFVEDLTSYEYRLVYFVLSSILGGKKAALKHIVPYIDQYMKDRQSMNEKHVILSLLTRPYIHADFRYYLEPRFGIYDSRCSS